MGGSIKAQNGFSSPLTKHHYIPQEAHMSVAHTVRIYKPNLTISYFENLDAAARYAVADDGTILPLCLIAMNAEKIIRLRKTPGLFSDCKNVLYYPDGASMLYFTQSKYPRMPGVELWLKVLERGQANGIRICVFGGSVAVSERAKAILTDRFPKAELTISNGFFEPNYYDEIVSRQQPGIVFVAMGTPRQEKMIARLQALSPQTLYMGVGGSLDVLTGEKKRAPNIFLNNNMEFAYRLLKEPRRAVRQTALLRFLILYYMNAFKAL
jgi:UDP-N-acetyl-D-mannosaminouronate:lipid I N-acetyl-D-mannosaminouronosyltransferase